MSKIKEIEKIQASIIEDLRVNNKLLLKELEELKANSPKYKVGQELLVVYNNKIVKIEIQEIKVKVGSIWYYYQTAMQPINENLLFATIQDLLDDLVSQEIKEL